MQRAQVQALVRKLDPTCHNFKKKKKKSQVLQLQIKNSECRN